MLCRCFQEQEHEVISFTAHQKGLRTMTETTQRVLSGVIMVKLNGMLALGSMLTLMGCASSIHDADALYHTYRDACPLNYKVTDYDVIYHGKIETALETYHMVGYSYSWEVLPGNHRGDGQILVFDHNYAFIGYFPVFGDPEVTITGKRMDLYFPRETKQNQRTYYDFAEGLPKTDMNNFGFDYCTRDEINRLRNDRL